MEVRESIYPLIVICALITLTMRVFPIVLLSRLSLPQWAEEWLEFVPIAVMTSIVVQEVFIKPIVGESNLHLILASLICIACCWLSNSLFLTVLAGAFSIYALQWL